MFRRQSRSIWAGSQQAGLRYLLLAGSDSQTSKVKAIAIIPARLASTRLPRKILREINGRPMLAYVYEATRACPALDDVSWLPIRTRSPQVCRAQRLESPNDVAGASSGTDRVHEVAQTVDGRCVRQRAGRRAAGAARASGYLLKLMANDDIAGRHAKDGVRRTRM